MRTTKAILGNVIYRITGSSVLIDEEWNKIQWKNPSLKSWINLVIIFPILLALLIGILFLLI